MKRFLYAAGTWVAAITLVANAQTGGASPGASAGTGTAVSSSGQGAVSASQKVNATDQNFSTATNAQNGTLPPGLQNRNQLPPGLQNREQLPPGLAKRTNEVAKSYDQPYAAAAATYGTNQFGGAYGSNQFGGNFGATNQFGGTNQFGAGVGTTNQFGAAGRAATNNFGYRGTNSSGLAPTGRTSATNQLYGTNAGRYAATNSQGSAGMRDQAFTAADRTLLVNVRQQVAPQLRLATGAWMPVHFTVNQGVVTIVGVVQTIEIKQQIEAIVVKVPGVAQAVNQLTIGASDAAAAGTVGAAGSPDEVLLTRVRQKVLPQVQLSSTVQIDFNVQNGTVMVMGSVPNFEEKRRIVALVKQVPGVMGVTDQTMIPLNATGQPTGQ